MKFTASSMLDPNVYNHPVKDLSIIETHISWVILTGDYAYKIKKPVNFGFLDFSSLAKRHRLCEQEIALNRRLAPGIYLEVVPITGSSNKPLISGSGEAFEYAVKMTQFPQSAQLDNMLAAGQLGARHMDSLAQLIADFHLATEIADRSVEYGDKQAVNYPVEENFRQIKGHLDTAPYKDTLTELMRWSQSEFTKCEAEFAQRKRDGFIRECHGDMHLRNLVWLDNHPMAFDCIEFNPLFRWIDVISEIAFLVMDLQSRQQHQLANRFLNSYLELTGDYAGLAVMPFYLCYRALVRAKVDALRIEQKNIPEKERKHSISEFKSYLSLALGYTKPAVPRLLIMRGLSASGKSTVSQQLLDVMGMIRIRSDVERKRIFDVLTGGNEAQGINAGIYSKQASQQTYAKLLELARQIITAGYSVIIDAAFLTYGQRQPFQNLARQLGIRYLIVETVAPVEVLRERIVKRTNDVSDANIAVLEEQLSNWEKLHEEEESVALRVDSENMPEIEQLTDLIDEL